MLRKMKLVTACLSQKGGKHDSHLSTRSYPKFGENYWPNLVMNFTFPTEKRVKKNQVTPHWATIISKIYCLFTLMYDSHIESRFSLELVFSSDGEMLPLVLVD